MEGLVIGLRSPFTQVFYPCLYSPQEQQNFFVSSHHTPLLVKQLFVTPCLILLVTGCIKSIITFITQATVSVTFHLVTMPTIHHALIAHITLLVRHQWLLKSVYSF